PHRAKRFNSFALRPDDFSASLVQRRRPDLERFDKADLAMIRYGIPLQFSGRMLRREYPTSPPMVAGVTWTTFWTY
ncbi:hypothetical protein, partial [Escherichia coli]|uniref:hypothetical protein n=1 Tax=Escherichia coli TaxID=562 RepID=UPI001952B52F